MRHAIILCAGRGTRISRHIPNLPKAAVEIAKDVTLIEYTIKLLYRHGFADITLVTGYMSEIIERLTASMGVRLMENPFFSVTNSVASLWFARDYLGQGETLVMNGDVYVEDDFFDCYDRVSEPPSFFYDPLRISEADYRFVVVENKLVRYGKDLSDDITSGEYIGVARFDCEDSRELGQRVKCLLKAGRLNEWWETAMYEAVSERSVHAIPVEGTFWGEVDYIEDYERIKQRCSLPRARSG